MAQNPGVTFTPIMHGTSQSGTTAHQILNELEAKDFLVSHSLPPPSAQAAWTRKNPMHKHHLKSRRIVKRTYELTEKGKQLLFWWETFIRAYEGEAPRQEEKPLEDWTSDMLMDNRHFTQ